LPIFIIILLRIILKNLNKFFEKMPRNKNYLAKFGAFLLNLPRKYLQNNIIAFE